MVRDSDSIRYCEKKEDRVSERNANRKLNAMTYFRVMEQIPRAKRERAKALHGLLADLDLVATKTWMDAWSDDDSGYQSELVQLFCNASFFWSQFLNLFKSSEGWPQLARKSGVTLV